MKIGVSIKRKLELRGDFLVPETALKPIEYDPLFLQTLQTEKIRGHTLYNPHNFPFCPNPEKFKAYLNDWLNMVQDATTSYQIEEWDVSEIFTGLGKINRRLVISPQELFEIIRAKFPDLKIILNDRFLLWHLCWKELINLAKAYNLELGFQVHCHVETVIVYLTSISAFRTFYQGKLHCSEASIWHRRDEISEAANQWFNLRETCFKNGCESLTVWYPVFNPSGYKPPHKRRNTGSGIYEVRQGNLTPNLNHQVFADKVKIKK